MDGDCSRPCRELSDLQNDYQRFRDETTRRLAAGDVSMAAINIKLNWLIGILSAIGAAVLTAVTKILIA